MTPFPPNLTPTALHEIVRDVPREAWPQRLSWHQMGRWTNGDSEWWISTDHLAHAFNGSMAAWLVEKESPASVTLLDTGDCVRVHIYHDGTGYELVKNHDAPTLLEALAAACKEAL